MIWKEVKRFFNCEHPSIYCTGCFRAYEWDFIDCNSIHKILFRIFYSIYKKLNPDFIIKKGLNE